MTLYDDTQVARLIAGVMRATGAVRVQVPVGRLLPPLPGDPVDTLVISEDPLTGDKIFHLRRAPEVIDGEEVPVLLELTGARVITS